MIIPAGVNTGGVSTRGRVDVGGGTWDYGADNDKGWSNYFHQYKNHGATTKQGDSEDRRDADAGVWATTLLYRSLFGGTMQSYWRVND
ncbi:lactococcin 972 family bacteriocin [Nocardia sp. NPDC051570]|uniref:lactococcin 972 family bacteriocin n=1 Tax=Nocardia sp. NPDC051570 TaxID=3364324 RepID=UPI0037985329